MPDNQALDAEPPIASLLKSMLIGGGPVNAAVRCLYQSRYLSCETMQAEVRLLESNNHDDWEDFARYQSPDPYDDFGWFHVTVGAMGEIGGDDFQVCVGTPRAVGRLQRSGATPALLVDQYDAQTVRKAICDRVLSVQGHTWVQIVDQLRQFMCWEYEGM